MFEMLLIDMLLFIRGKLNVREFPMINVHFIVKEEQYNLL